jgi:hypothetical protein
MRFVTPISPFPRHFKSANAGSWHPPLTRTQDYRPPGNFKTPRPAGPGASYGCQVEGSVASSTTDGAYDRDSVYGAVIDRDPKAAVIVPSRSTAGRARRLKPSPRNGTIVSGISPTKTGWGTAGSRPAIRRYRPVIGHGPRLRKAGYRTAGHAAAAHILNRTLELGRPICVCIA